MAHKLLLADDSVTIQRVIELTFADEDIQVISVGDGEQAIERIESERPDIVLADVAMPGRDGYEVTAHVKGAPHLAHVPVLLLTGAFEPVDEDRARDAGCDGVLSKPFEPQTVINRVRDLLQQAGHSVAPEPAAPDVAETEPGGIGLDSAFAEPNIAGPANEPAQGPWPVPASSGAREAGAEELDDYFDRLDADFASLGVGESFRRPRQGASLEQAAGSVPAPPADAAPPVPEPTAPPLDEPSTAEAAPALAAGPSPTGASGLDVTSPKPVVVALPTQPPVERFPALAAVEPAEEPGRPAVPMPPAARPPDEPRPHGESVERVEEPRAVPVAPVSASESTVLGAPQVSSGVAVPPASPVPPVSLADAFAALLNAEQQHAGGARSAAPAQTERVSDELVERVTRSVLERMSDRVVREMASEAVLKVADRLVREEIERIKGGGR